jgi:hypothetical protein
MHVEKLCLLVEHQKLKRRLDAASFGRLFRLLRIKLSAVLVDEIWVYK